MLFKIKFRNFACFKEWQEIDLVNRSFEDEIDFIPSCSNVLIGSKSVGKSSFIKLLNTAIDYVNNFIKYESEFKLDTTLKSMRNFYNPFVLFDDGDAEKYNDTEVILYFNINQTSFKYELVFNGYFPQLEKISYSCSEVLDDIEWVEIYSKNNLEFSLNLPNNDSSNTCIFDINLNLEELELDKQPNTNYLNLKNSLVLKICNFSKNMLTISISDFFKNIIFFKDNYLHNKSFKKYSISKEFIELNRTRYLNVFKDLDINIKDFKVTDESVNEFNLLLSKKDENGTFHFVNSLNESDNIRRLFYLLTIVFKALDKKSILFVDDLNNYLSLEQTNYILNMFSDKDKNVHNSQLITTVSSYSTYDFDDIYCDNKFEVDKSNGFSSTIFKL